MACSLSCITDIILLVIFCVTLPLYIIILYVLIKGRKTTFKGSFFKCFVSLGIIDIVKMLDTYFFINAMKWRVYNWIFLSYPVIIATTFQAIRWIFFFAQMFGVLLLTLNRYVAIVYPMDVKIVFTPERTKMMIAVKWLMSMVMALPRPLMIQSLRYGSDNQTLVGFWVSAKHAGWNGVYQKIGALSNLFVAVVAIALYARMIYNVYINSHHGDVENDNNVKKELRLAFVGIIIGLSYSAYGVVGISLGFLGISFYNPMMQLYYSVVVDLTNGVNPFALFFFCESVRIEVRKMCCCGAGENRVTSIGSKPKCTGKSVRKQQSK